MVRRIASQVHKTASRLKQAKLIPEPAWFQAVLQHPPLPIPPRGPPPRSRFDAKFAQRPSSTRPVALPVVYLEDKVRRQFFRDHPFHALRERTLAEDGGVEQEHAISGKDWTRLSQRGRHPQPEDVVRFTVNLHQHHEMSLSLAYELAVAQFHSLKAEFDIATEFAVHEAEFYGAEFGPRQVDLTFDHETKQLRTWSTLDHEQDEAALAARKRWRAVLPNTNSDSETWSYGQEYVRLWQSGIRPTYLPPAPDSAHASTESASKDLNSTVKG